PTADGSAEEKKRVGCKTKKRIAALRAKLAQIAKRVEVFHVVRLNIEQDDVGAFQPHFRRLKEENSHGRGVRKNLRPIEHLVVQGNGKRAKSEIARALEQLMRGVVEMILGVIQGVDVEIDLDPILLRSGLELVVLLLLLVLDHFSSRHRLSLNAGSRPRSELLQVLGGW